MCVVYPHTHTTHIGGDEDGGVEEEGDQVPDLEDDSDREENEDLDDVDSEGIGDAGGGGGIEEEGRF